MALLLPREAGKFIASKATHVNINMDNLKLFAQLIATSAKEGKLEMKSFKMNELLPLNKGLTQDQLINYLFFVNSLNFNFWTPKAEPKYTVTHRGKTKCGYVAMLLAFERAMDEGKLMYDPKFFSSLTLTDVKNIFRSDTTSPMPLLVQRVEVANEVGSILLEKYDGNFANVLREADRSAIKVVDLVTSHFPCFNDVHAFEGESVAIFKRAQILIADLVLLYEGKSLCHFTDIDQLTMFADYRVPQVLAYFKVIQYSEELWEKLNAEHLFNTGDREEVEIRGVSIHACELLVEETNKILKDLNMSNRYINSVKVDFFLWDYRYLNADALEAVEYHKTRCIYY